MQTPAPKCRHCQIVMSDGDFYASDPRACKECIKARVRRNRKDKARYYRAYDRKRYRENPSRKEHCKSMGKKISAEQRRDYLRKRRKEAPEKMKARRAVQYALSVGKIEKQPCFFCGAAKNVHAHHEDYDHPLDVVWLCPSCHGKLHTIRGDFRREDAA